ncbi:MAG: PQQ-dependent sugar dehydrogenase [Anaerolineae bacterium]|nr:PQQ-dependent sugar dehydrogenase [Anaerolineae bacterium]
MESIVFHTPRRIDPADVQVPPGYRIEAVAAGLAYPTNVAFDSMGGVYVAEAGYSYGGTVTDGRILRVEPDGTCVQVVGGLRGPVGGIAYYRDGTHDGFFITEGGYPPRVSYAGLDGSYRPILEGLYGPGDHFLGMPVVAPDGWLYFGQGTYTNAGIVGPDNYGYGWLALQPMACDVPGYDVTLTGQNYSYLNPLSIDGKRRARTGAFSPVGQTTQRGQRIRGRVPCTGAIMRCRLDGSGLEVVAWGLRNPHALLFVPDGRLYCIDRGYEDRGVRPVGNAPEPLYEIRQGAWYGWPDYAAGEPVWNPRYRPEHGAPAEPLLQDMPAPQKPVFTFAPRTAPSGFDLSRDGFGYANHLFIAEFGAGAPIAATEPYRAGHCVVRLDLQTRTIETFAANRHPGPASAHGGGGLERPVEARFNPAGEALYVVDLGLIYQRDGIGMRPYGRTGVLWRITRG